MSTCSQKLAKIVMQRQNPYLNTDYNSLYNFDPEEETFSNIKNARITKYTEQAKRITVRIAKPRIIINDLFID